MRTPPLLADFSHARACKPFCENSLTLPVIIGMQLIFIGKWRHRRLDYLSAQQSIAVKDAQRGEANSLTDLLGCATSHPEITEDIRR